MTLQTPVSIDSSATASSPRPLGVCLAFDFGEARIGVAVGNGLTGTAQALEIIAKPDNKSRFDRIAVLIEQWGPDCLVVGVPRHPDGQAHEMTARCEKFVRQLEGRFGKPVHGIDERYTSVEAESRQSQGQGRGQARVQKMAQGRGHGVDAVAACIILEQFFLEQSR